MPHRSVIVLVSLAAASGPLGACSAQQDNEGGFGAPRQPSAAAVAGAREALSGTVVVRPNGCVDLDLGERGQRWLVWPPSARGATEGMGVSVGGTVVTAGARVTGKGAVVDASVLPGFANPDSYFGSFGRFCTAQDVGVVVLDEATVSPA